MNILSNSDRTREHFDLIAHEFSRREWVTSLEIANSILKGLSRIAPTKNALEIGIGTGEFTKILINQGIEVIGLDISKNMLNYAKNRFKDISLVNADSHLIPFKDKVFNVIVGRNFLRHLHDLPLFFNEVNRVLNHSGQIAFAENCVISESDRTFMNKIINLSEPYQKPFLLDTEFAYICENYGFKEIITHSFSRTQIATREYFRRHYLLSESTINQIWQLFQQVDEDYRIEKELIKLSDDSYQFKSHWIVITAQSA